MKLIDIVKKAQYEGHTVTFRKRSDGGITVTSLDGVKFTDLTSGNKALRAITGEELSQLQQMQRRAINEQFRIPSKATPKQIQKIKAKAKARRHAQTPKQVDDLTKEIRKTQRIWRENVDQTVQGRITTKKIRNIEKREGKEAAMSALKKYQSYAKGYAYEENVRALAQRYEMSVLNAMKSLEIDDDNKELVKSAIVGGEGLVRKIMSMLQTFREEWIAPINAVIYEAEVRYRTAVDDEKIYILMDCTLTIDKIIS